MDRAVGSARASRAVFGALAEPVMAEHAKWAIEQIYDHQQKTIEETEPPAARTPALEPARPAALAPALWEHPELHHCVAPQTHPPEHRCQGAQIAAEQGTRAARAHGQGKHCPPLGQETVIAPASTSLPRPPITCAPSMNQRGWFKM